MKNFIWVSIILILAIAVAGFNKFNSGQVMIYIANYSLGLSLNLLLVLWLISFGIIYYICRIYINIMRLPNKIQRSRLKSALIISRRHLNLAGLHYFEGKYRSCYNNALISVKKEFSLENKFLAYLLAFISASIMRNSIKEAEILNEINQFKNSKWQLAKHMVIADNLYNDRQFGLCIDNLNAALKMDHKHIPAHRMLLKVYLHLGNFHKAYEMLSWLLKNDSLREYKANEYKSKVISGLFATTNEIDEIIDIFSNLSSAEQSSFLFGKLYFDNLLRLHEYRLATDFLETRLKNGVLESIYTDSLVALCKKSSISASVKLNQSTKYNRAKSQSFSEELVERLLILAEECLNLNQNNSQLLLALGILNYHKQEWTKAKTYLTKSVELKPSLDGYLYILFIAVANKDNTLAANCQSNLLINIQDFI